MINKLKSTITTILRTFGLIGVVKYSLKKLGLYHDTSTVARIATFSDALLMSSIGNELHHFNYPEKGKNRTTRYLSILVNEARKRDLGYLKRVKDAQRFIARKQVRVREEKKVEIKKKPLFKEFFDIAENRQSIRKFTEQQISQDVIDRIISCAINAPSSCNRQPWRFLIVNDMNDLIFLSKIRRIPYIQRAPVVIVIFADTTLYKNKNELGYSVWMDSAAAIMNMTYAIEALGMSSVWINFGELEIPEEKARMLRERFTIEDTLMVISAIAFGYPNQVVNKPTRESIDYYIIKDSTEITIF